VIVREPVHEKRQVALVLEEGRLVELDDRAAGLLQGARFGVNGLGVGQGQLLQ